MATVVVVSVTIPALYVASNAWRARAEGGGRRHGEGGGGGAGGEEQDLSWRSSAAQFGDGLTALFTEHRGQAEQSSLSLIDGELLFLLFF
jgi:hypothetical protein